MYLNRPYTWLRRGWAQVVLSIMSFAAFCAVAMAADRAELAARADFYVAPNGNDTWSGTLATPNRQRSDGPFATPARARDAVRDARAKDAASRPYTVLLRGGVYYLSEPLAFGPEDAGQEKAPVTFAAYPGEKPVLSAGRQITGWRKGQDGLWTAEIPAVKDGRWYFNQLFVNGQRRTRARTPNEGFLRAAGPVPEIDDPHKHRGDIKACLGFSFKPGDIKRWDDLEDVNIVLYYDWSTSRHWIKELDEERDVVRFTNRTGWPVCWWERDQRYHLENYREALDQPGEWYLNRETGTLYYWPVKGEDPARATIVAPAFEHVVTIDGTPEQERYVDYLNLRGLSFQHADWSFGREEQLEAQAAVFCTGAVLARGARNCNIERCEIAHVGGYALWFEQGCKSNRIFHCEVRDTGAGGIRVGETAYRDQPSLITENNVVDNCYIHDAGHVFPDGVGVWVGHASYNRVTHNEICDIIYSGISAGWSWGYGNSGCHHNVIEWNHIHHLGFGVLSELSSIYTLGVSPGTRIRYNLCYDAVDYRFGTWVMGLDEGTSYVLVENNIGYNHRHGIGLHYGRENEIRNNIIALCQKDQVGVGRVEEHLSLVFHHNILLGMDQPLISGAFGKAKVESDYNVYWDGILQDETDFDGLTFEEWQAKGRDKHSVLADPLFVDPAKGDFTLKPNSPALKLGFKPFDLRRAGLYGEPEWVQAPRKIKRMPLSFELSPGEAEGVADDFESTAVGQLPNFAQVSGEDKGASIRVSDETAAEGKHSLKFTDAPGLEASWQPHMYYNLAMRRGEVKVSFDIRLEKGAKTVVQWRDWPGGSDFRNGPTLLFADGQLLVGDKPVTNVPLGQRVHVEMLCPVGRVAERTFILTVTAPGAQPVKVEGLPAGDARFRHLTWLGFISEATDTTVFYIDNIKVERKQ